jgi:hypothetical protein
MSLSKPWLLSIVLLGAACGGDFSAISPTGESPIPDPVRGSVACAPTDVRVAGGGERVSRTAAIYVRFDGEAPADLRIRVEGPTGKHGGELFEGPGRVTFLPSSPFPAHQTLTWRVRMCGATTSGTFHTGALIHPVSEATLDERFVGERFAIDTRVGNWSAPAGAVDNSALRFSFGGAILVDVMERVGAELRLGLSAALADNAGGYVSDARVVPVMFDASLTNNPYLAVELAELSLPTTHGDVAIRDLRLSLGLGADGFDDVRVEGMLDLGSENSCRVLEGSDGEPCLRCVEAGPESCRPLVVEKLFGLRL